MAVYESTFWTPFPRPTVLGLSIVMLILSLLLAPFYLALVKVLKKEPIFKENIFYFILSNVALVDVAFANGTSMAAMMSLKHDRYFPLLYEICSAIHALYDWTLHLFCLILALKIVIVIFDLERSYTTGLLKFLTLFIWKALIINLYVNDAVDIEYVYTFDVINFSVDLKTESSRRTTNIWFYFNLAFVVAAFTCYLLVAAYFLLKKFKYATPKPFEECHLLFIKQGLATFLPAAIYFVINSILSHEVAKASVALSLFASLLPRFIPVCNFFGLLIIDRDLRCAYMTRVRNYFCRCRNRTEVTEIEVTTQTSPANAEKCD